MMDAIELDRHMNTKGFTLIEIIVVLGLIGLLAAVAFRSLGPSFTAQQVRSARDQVASMHAKARANAIRRGSVTTLHLTSGNLMITSREPLTGNPDTIGAVYDVVAKYGVSFTMVSSPTRDSLVFDSRGIGTETSPTDIIVSRSGYTDTVTVSAVGRILK